MDDDDILAEVLYPTLGLKVFSIEDRALHEAACHAYNVWLAEYCSYAPDRLIGIGMIPTFDVERAWSDNCMWSNDYPHAVTTWPYSRKFVADQFEQLEPDVREKQAFRNVEALYHLSV